ncbi:uncharacterized protein KLLA0_E11727g [Kluyveromyces lactis]|uniref:Dolichol phosphate-mannose biosynthesis regulatory protein n=1 Tax=Kluyveromyces lactis (strain ATCC 8585 / CBS 2359 / DSM 70799 / NBRC 1267 / NRRL Y-1140 / WM37) TaxID=284590 RepID=B4UN70_KLULA|nr:uncharacterized protein KLLA0_E11727g [Kluyveromyces lactis]CAR56741.1 KLLA0E11727p [Kluyveromyces lactis]|eukprot:XP_002999403.1 uncharacterized protein KLLA0_E11727g [Kluyveromyces lactis]
MKTFSIILALFIYYCVWLLLPIFDLDQKVSLFPLSSQYAVGIPILLLLLGTSIVGTSVAVMLWNDCSDVPKTRDKPTHTNT